MTDPFDDDDDDIVVVVVVKTFIQRNWMNRFASLLSLYSYTFLRVAAPSCWQTIFLDVLF